MPEEDTTRPHCAAPQLGHGPPRHGSMPRADFPFFFCVLKVDFVFEFQRRPPDHTVRCLEHVSRDSEGLVNESHASVFYLAGRKARLAVVGLAG